MFGEWVFLWVCHVRNACRVSCAQIMIWIIVTSIWISEIITKFNPTILNTNALSCRSGSMDLHKGWRKQEIINLFHNIFWLLYSELFQNALICLNVCTSILGSKTNLFYLIWIVDVFCENCRVCHHVRLEKLGIFVYKASWEQKIFQIFTSKTIPNRHTAPFLFICLLNALIFIASTVIT